MKGPAIFLAQFAGTEPPFDKLETMAQWAASLGYVGVQVPTYPTLFDLEQAAKSQTYCDETMAQWAVSLGYVGVLCKASSSRSSRLPRLNSRVSRRRTFVKSRMRGPRSNSKILGLDE